MVKTIQKVQDRKATIRLVRLDESDIRHRESLIFIDGAHEALLRYGDEKILLVDPGHHKIYATNRVAKTKPIEFFAEVGEIVSFTTGNFTNWHFNFCFLYFQIGLPTIKLKLVSHERPMVMPSDEDDD